mmetsp:Transcript_115173/g.332700  ORF Transcript_115173/g.332700 Transcript_115173/m.332700 type:complete len:332 (-) Transcript_115173:98-1093(-)
MADDELLLEIDKCFWPKGVMRGLTPALRALGDRHGNLVIAAQPTKNVIMVKGAPELIEGVKAELRELIEEHFPDAPIPDALCEGGGVAGHAAEEPQPMEEEGEEEPPEAAPAPVAAPVATPASAAPAAPKAPPAPAAAATPRTRAGAGKAEQRLGGVAGALAKAVEAAALEKKKQVRVRVRPRPPTAGAPPALLWECMRKSSSFMRKPVRELKQHFSAEPVNLMGLHSARWSGLASTEAIDIRPKVTGNKEKIILHRSCTRACHRRRPRSLTCEIGLRNCPRKGIASLDQEMAGRSYRRDAWGLAREKYIRVQQSFKKKKRKAAPAPRAKK